MTSASFRSTVATLGRRARRGFVASIHRGGMWLEVLVITLGAMGLGLFFQRDNPFQIGGEFPWLWLAPVLVALRYGVMAGMISALLLAASWQGLAYMEQSKGSFPQQYFLGGLILVILSGQFSAAWGVRLRRAEETSRYLGERLNRITLRHLLLRLSHEHMEQEILSKPATLRDALDELRKLTSVQSDERMPAAAALLQLLTQSCQLESAAIYLAAPGGRAYERICEIGSPPDLHATDPLLVHALKHKTLSHLITDDWTDMDLPSAFLVVAPILSSEGRMLGVLTVERMPFLALREENLQMLAVMLGYYADCVAESDGTRKFFEHFPDAPAEFAAEFARMLRLQRSFDIDSHIIALSFGSDESGRQAFTQHELIKRSLDVSWQLEVDGRMVLANLMPLANEAAVRDYLLRIEAKLKQYTEIGYDEPSLTPVVISLAEADPLASLLRITRGVTT